MTDADYTDRLCDLVLSRQRKLDNQQATRAWLALRLARTPDAWAGLLMGEPVAKTAIDQEELDRQRRLGLWR